MGILKDLVLGDKMDHDLKSGFRSLDERSTWPTATFDTTRCKVPVLVAVDYRVPLRGDLYLGKDKKLHRCHEDRQFSKRAKKCLILREVIE